MFLVVTMLSVWSTMGSVAAKYEWNRDTHLWRDVGRGKLDRMLVNNLYIGIGIAQMDWETNLCMYLCT